MKKLLTLALTVVAVALFTAPAVAQVPRGKQPIPRPKIPTRIVLCRDPAAQSLTVQILSRGPHTTEARIRITGVVKNVGNRIFESDPRQALVDISETHPGARATIKAQQNIARLAPNETITLNFELAWLASSEFPPTYALMITYDPDIYIDGKPNNDDCNQRNNRKDLSGDEINRVVMREDSAKKP